MTGSRTTKAALSASLQAEQRRVKREQKSAKVPAVRVALPLEKTGKRNKLSLEVTLSAEEAALLSQLKADCRLAGLNVKKRTLMRLGLRVLARLSPEELAAMLEREGRG